MPFPIRAVQIDGGPEFAAEFEQACQQRGLHLFVLPPRSPKLNGAVERANRTHTEEFYQVTAYSLEMKKLNRELRHWEKIYNTVRPHHALGCPENLIVVSSERNEKTRRKELTNFTYDLSRCMFCGLCEDACPTDALELTQDFELANYSREDMIWDRETLEKGPRPTVYKK